MKEIEKMGYLDEKGIPFSRADEKSDKKATREKKLKINKRACTKCMICYALCPEGAIEIKGGYPDIDYKKCNACFICLRECPDAAIEEISD
ncbi:MAG: pyruvate synthase [Candidatus Aenigmatarchaeota archaeon]|nr:MAG: pyruvate synthase [Candidatus Aenigmarchaeota archaeon ex4484_14]RLI96783.1 MAG: pyruvate synthase [Candidatus Aenigmarchaeota archaeon]